MKKAIVIGVCLFACLCRTAKGQEFSIPNGGFESASYYYTSSWEFPLYWYVPYEKNDGFKLVTMETLSAYEGKQFIVLQQQNSAQRGLRNPKLCLGVHPDTSFHDVGGGVVVTSGKFVQCISGYYKFDQTFGMNGKMVLRMESTQLPAKAKTGVLEITETTPD